MTEVEVFVGVVIKNDDGSEDRYAETRTVQRMDVPKAVASAGMRALKKILADIRSKP